MTSFTMVARSFVKGARHIIRVSICGGSLANAAHCLLCAEFAKPCGQGIQGVGGDGTKSKYSFAVRRFTSGEHIVGFHLTMAT